MERSKFEPHVFDLMDNMLESESIFLDIGCSVGPFTLYASTFCRGVIACDPDPVVFSVLGDNIELNQKNQSKIIAKQVAISSETGTTNLHARRGFGASSTRLLRSIRDEFHEDSVQCMNLLDLLDSVGESRIDFIKIDIEGGEFDLLRSWKKVLRDVGYPTVYVEFHYPRLRESIFYNKGYSLFVSRVIMAIEKKVGLMFFKSETKRIMSSAFEAFQEYGKIELSEYGRISYGDLIENPLLIRKSDLSARRV